MEEVEKMKVDTNAKGPSSENMGVDSSWEVEKDQDMVEQIKAKSRASSPKASSPYEFEEVNNTPSESNEDSNKLSIFQSKSKFGADALDFDLF